MKAYNNISLAWKLPGLIILLSVLTAVAIVASSYRNAKALLEVESEYQMQNAVAYKASALKHWADTLETDVRMLAENPGTLAAVEHFGSAFYEVQGDRTEELQKAYSNGGSGFRGGNGESYVEVHGQYHSFFKHLMEEVGYYDIFIISENGNIVYSVLKEPDFATNLKTGRWSSSNLAHAFEEALNEKDPQKVFFEDFAPYGPSANEPAAFLSHAIFGQSGEVLGVIAFQLPVDRLNQIMAAETALGKNGHFYVAAADRLMRSDLDLTEENDVLATHAKNYAVDHGLDGESGITQIVNEHGVTVPAAFAPVEVLGTRWALVGELDHTETPPAVVALGNSLILPSVLCILGVAIAGLFVARSITSPLNHVRESVERVAAGDYASLVPETLRGDEIGAIASRLDKMRSDLAAASEERALVLAEREQMEKAQQHVVSSLSIGLSSLAAGDLTQRIDQTFADEYDKLRLDFNAAIEGLEGVIHSVVTHAVSINGSCREVSRAAEDLSQRTEEQAATLEESAAALEQLSASVRSTAEGADKANRYVSETRQSADSSGAIVGDTVNAMNKIQGSSDQISQIIGVIDDIAFQTNLLALNAGVEAARAGEAGRGFAVVASEVRALAQRSSDAAKEIKELISNSSQQVEQGVDLVGKTGKALNEIVEMVGNISSLVSEITVATGEQSTGLAEINTAIAQLDQVTQQNTAMVGESTAASQDLGQEAEELHQLTARFQLGKTSPAPKVAQTPSPSPTASGNTALALLEEFDEDDWSDI